MQGFNSQVISAPDYGSIVSEDRLLLEMLLQNHFIIFASSDNKLSTDSIQKETFAASQQGKNIYYSKDLVRLFRKVLPFP